MGNKICHIELVAENMAEAQTFYSKVFGWSVTPMGEEYALWSSGEGTMGGGFSSGSSTGQRTLAYIEVEDIEATLKQIEETGGKTNFPKTQISEEHGYFAMFTDPNGTVVGLWSKG